MAKNWTVAEAVEAILNHDKNGILDFGKRFPLATNVLTEVLAGSQNKEAVIEFVNALPVKQTMGKLNAAMKSDVEESEEDVSDVESENEDSEDEAPKKRGRTPKSDEEKKAAAKARREARKAKAAEEDEEEDDFEEETDEEDNPYAGKSAVELYKLCMKRKIKAVAKKNTDYYINLLKKNDVAESDEDEDDEEEAPAAPKAKGKKSNIAAITKTTKPAKEEIDEDEDEDDWDI